MNNKSFIAAVSLLFIISAAKIFGQTELKYEINDKGYYEVQGSNIMVFDDFYPEGHQGGVTIVQRDVRLVTNGDVRLEPTPGQWAPVPAVGKRTVDKKNGTIQVELWYPDSTKNRKGFNPIVYPDLKFHYTVKTEAIGKSIKVTVSLNNPLPAEWADKVGFNLEIFPGAYFGEHYFMDGKSGMFPRQENEPLLKDADGNLQITPMAIGKELLIAPGSKEKQIKIESSKNELQLIDERGLHNSGWFVLRSTIAKGAAENAVEWIISPAIDTSWRYTPVIQASQVGYHPKQTKFAVIELDKLTKHFESVQLIKITSGNETIVKEEKNPSLFGKFLRYKYVRFDFSDVSEAGLYKIKYGAIESNKFEIKKDIYANNVWQPSLEYFLPVQMCHVKVEDKYRVWHGLCHMDDALMAPINYNHFDGYLQGSSTLTKYLSGEHVPDINIGGWHDAGDYDLRIESQAETVYKLSLAYELFKNDIDQTSVNQQTRLVEIHQPDGIPDFLQQIENGLLSIVGGYESLGRLYRGIQEATLRQYVLLGDGTNATDNYIYKPDGKDPVLNNPLPKDDRLVFTEINPSRELYAAQTLAAASRVTKKYKPELSVKCLKISEEIYKNNSSAPASEKINAAAELYLATSKTEYKNFLLDNRKLISGNIPKYCLVIGRVVNKINNKDFTAEIESSVKKINDIVVEQSKENPYGVPYHPYIWGAGWGIQSMAVGGLFLHLSFPEIFKSENVFNALNFILGCHPGSNTASFASGVGVNSLTVAYGTNRADWSYIPGGIGSGTALIRPDLPELKVWPYFWQQAEYVLGDGTVDYILLAMAAENLFNK
jgi:endoglucanase